MPGETRVAFVQTMEAACRFSKPGHNIAASQASQQRLYFCALQLAVFARLQISNRYVPDRVPNQSQRWEANGGRHPANLSVTSFR